jgi:hypothetical protein
MLYLTIQRGNAALVSRLAPPPFDDGFHPFPGSRCCFDRRRCWRRILGSSCA